MLARVDSFKLGQDNTIQTTFLDFPFSLRLSLFSIFKFHRDDRISAIAILTIIIIITMVAATGTKSWLVQKYGGTSLGKLLDTICCKIIPQYSTEHNLIVVCSALSGTLKASGTTSLLLQCITYAEQGFDAQKQLVDLVDLIKDNHLSVLRAFMNSPARMAIHSQVYEETVSGIQNECEGLKRFLLAAQVSFAGWKCHYD